MYELLIPSVIQRFSAPGQSERGFLESVQQADIRLGRHFRSKGKPVSPLIYGDPLIRVAYLLRHLGHYSLQLGDVLIALEGQTTVASVLSQPYLKIAALCGGAGPEAIAMACLHRQFHGQLLEVQVLDLNAYHWSDCWPISAAIAKAYPSHPCVNIEGLAINLFSGPPEPVERTALAAAHVFTAMNCLNELVGFGDRPVSEGLGQRLSLLRPGALVLASDQAGYEDCSRGMNLLRILLQERGARFLLDDLDQPHEVANRLVIPPRIAWMYGAANQNRFRINVRTFRLAAVMP